MKMRKIDFVIVFACAIAAALTGIGSLVAPFIFVFSSSLGLYDAIKGKVLTAALVNGIFLTLNLYFIFKAIAG